MQILLNPQKTNLVFTDHKMSHSDQYLELREEIWQESEIKMKAQNKEFFNGELYTIEKIQNNHLDETEIIFGLCEFKDIMMKRKNLNFCISHNELDLHTSADLLLKCSDDKFIFGIRDNKTSLKAGSIGTIGGSLNKDEMVITKFSNIDDFMKLEFRQELGLDPDQFHFEFKYLNQFNAKYEFLYLVTTDWDSKTLIDKANITEFSELIAMHKDEVINYSKDTTDAFAFTQLYINAL